MSIFKDLENYDVWKNFELINTVPRASKKEEQIIAFMVAFGKKLGLETIQDEVGNVIIKKPAANGGNADVTVILQSHLDMVHQKNNDTIFDFDTQGIEMYVDGEWVRANGTTLGADNGMGVAAIMAILESANITHPNIEALFTIDEETGMTGAKGLKGGLLKGTILLNLDTEDDHEITIGCAGGIDVTATYNYEEVPVTKQKKYEIVVNGLNGGHSGMEIHKGLGNANKIMNRILLGIFNQHEAELISVVGGGLRNAIPRESVALIATDANFEATFNQIKEALYDEYNIIEPNINISCKLIDINCTTCLSKKDSMNILHAIQVAYNGVYRMSPAIEGLVEASNNIARVELGQGTMKVLCLTRSSVETSKMDVVQQLTSAFTLLGAEVTTSGDYPGWSPNPKSDTLQLLAQCYKDLYGDMPHITACHAGLECGILATHYPHLDMVSFGPTILGAHSPDERVNIKSVNKFYMLLLNILNKI